jgi:tetratricopeptide (TPR) repeat protein
MLVTCSLTAALAQAPGPAVKAYEALRAGDYDSAIALFRQAIEAAPENAGLRKDLGYTLLKTGETEEARDQFAGAIRLDPAAEHIALEYGFLCYETKKQAEARRTFDRIRKTGSPEARATAEKAFQNVDRPLAEGIARWSAVVAQMPGDFSAHLELARLAEQRDELELAGTHYLAAWKLRIDDRQLLLHAGRVWQALGRTDQAQAAFLAASRTPRPWVAEQARELLPRRHPYVPEFRRAIELDPTNAGLRRDLAYLLIELKQKDEAERELRALVEQAPADLEGAAQLGFLMLEGGDREGALVYLDRVLKSDDDELIARVRSALRMPAALRRRQARGEAAKPAGQSAGAKEMGERSYKAGYLKDAIRYFEAAHEADPMDFEVMLKLGWTHNALKQDDVALSWFDMARHSPDAAVAAEARKAYQGLRPEFARWRLTAWVFPFFSTRWHDLFAYGQVKAEYRLGNLPFRPYVSLRFIGDSRGTTGEALPQYLSESSFLVALGVATRTWHNAMAWFEAGTAIRYTGARDRGLMAPDYRGGVSYNRGKGQLLGGEAPGWFAETHDDGVFVSRFGNDFLAYSQNQIGYTLPVLAGIRAQLYCNVNLTVDTQREDWANFGELGPGLRIKWPGLPDSVVFSVNAVHGSYLKRSDPTRPATFHDVRAGFWYAFTH